MDNVDKVHLWKEPLLKSSLPLEHATRELVEKANFTVFGSYKYIRNNEIGMPTEFSIDLLAVDHLEHKGEFWGTLELLIECKYNHPGVQWVFVPHTSSSLIISDVFTTLDELTTYRVSNDAPLRKLENELEYCASGVQISGKDFDSNSISKGLSQLRYATPNFIAHRCENQMDTSHEEDLNVCFFTHILVTTAPLFILKRAISIEDIRKANSIGDVAEPVEALIHYDTKGPDLQKYTSAVLGDLATSAPGILKRVYDACKITEVEMDKSWDPKEELLDTFRHPGDNILIINIDALPSYLSKMKKYVRECRRHLRRVMKLEVNIDSGEKLLVKI